MTKIKKKKIGHADLGGRIVTAIVIDITFIIWQLIMFTFSPNSFWKIEAILIIILLVIIDLLIIIFGEKMVDFFTELLSWI